MDKDAVLTIIRRFKRALEAAGVRVDRIILCGSWADGSAEDGSDIDLVVISDDFANKGYWDRINMLSDAIYTVFQPIEAVAFTPAEWKEAESSNVFFARNGELIS